MQSFYALQLSPSPSGIITINIKIIYFVLYICKSIKNENSLSHLTIPYKDRYTLFCFIIIYYI